MTVSEYRGRPAGSCSTITTSLARGRPFLRFAGKVDVDRADHIKHIHPPVAVHIGIVEAEWNVLLFFAI